MTLLKNNGPGIYLTKDSAAKIVSNTPGELTLGTVGTDYIYLEEIVLFDHALNFGNQGDNMPGKIISKVGTGQTDSTTGEGDLGGFTIHTTLTESLAELLERLGKLDNRTTKLKLFLIRQTSSDVFRQFPNDSGVLKKYCPITIFTTKTTEKHEGGFDFLLSTVVCGEVWGRV